MQNFLKLESKLEHELNFISFLCFNGQFWEELHGLFSIAGEYTPNTLTCTSRSSNPQKIRFVGRMVPNYNLNLVNRCILTLLGKYYDLKLFLKKIMNDKRRILL